MTDDREVSFIASTGQRPLAHFAALVNRLNPTSEDLKSAGTYLVEKTRSQALSGFDVNNNAFAPYSPAYQKAKKQAQVDLYSRTANVHMLDNLKAHISASPPSIQVGIFDDEELALRARVNDGGLTLSGGQAKTFLRKLKNVSRRKKAGLNRKLKGRGSIQVVPARHFLAITPQDVRIIGEMIMESIVRRLNS